MRLCTARTHVLRALHVRKPWRASFYLATFYPVLHTCPHSACPRTRNGALLPSPPPFARMHVPAHMTTPYSSHFLEPMAVKSSVLPASFSFVARVSSSEELRTHSNSLRLPKPLVKFRSVPRACRDRRGTDLELRAEEHRFRVAETTAKGYKPYFVLQLISFFSIVKERLDVFLITNNISA